MQNNNKIPSQLRVLRAIKGVTLAELGNAIGRAPSWLSRAERGLPGATVSPLDAVRIGAALVVDPKNLFSEVGK